MRLVSLQPLSSTAMVVNPDNITFLVSYSSPGDSEPTTTIHFAGAKENFTIVKGSVPTVVRQLGLQ